LRMKKPLGVALKERHEAGRFASAAAQLAGWGAEAEIVHVLETDADAEFTAADGLVRDAVEQFQARGFVASGHVHPMTTGSVANRLAEHARESGADLIVMGSRGLGRVGGLLGRSVSHAVLARVALPVLVIPQDAHVAMHGIRRVLVAVADEGDADALIETLRQIDGKTELLLVHVPRLVGVHVEGETRDRFAEIPQASAVVLSKARERLKRVGIEASTRTLDRKGSVARAITAAACESEVDLVVAGSRRLHDWEALVTGSTSHDLLGCSERPVLIAGKDERPATRA
jgi:nucleotide-binding universal stress UspA family protein